MHERDEDSLKKCRDGATASVKALEVWLHGCMCSKRASLNEPDPIRVAWLNVGASLCGYL